MRLRSIVRRRAGQGDSDTGMDSDAARDSDTGRGLGERDGIERDGTLHHSGCRVPRAAAASCRRCYPLRLRGAAAGPCCVKADI